MYVQYCILILNIVCVADANMPISIFIHHHNNIIIIIH
jgi:hypothetical protein